MLTPLAMGALAAAPAAAAETGTIEGQIVGRGGATALGGAPVLLEIGTGAATPEERSATTGDDGRFRIDNVPLDTEAAGFIYLLRVTYDGGPYYREVTFAQGATTAQVPPIEVYPATRSDDAIAFVRERMLVTVVNPEGLQIVETGAFQNTGDRAYVGPGGGGEARTLQFVLPTGAIGVSIAQGLDRNTLVEAPDGFASIEAIPPGEVQFAYSYVLVPQGRTLQVARTFPYRTDFFQVFVPTGLRVEAPDAALKDSGTTTLPNGQEYHLYTGQDLATGTPLSFRLANLPTAGSAVNPLLPAMAVFVTVLGLGLLFAYGRRRALAPAAAGRTTVRRVPAGRADRADGADRATAGEAGPTATTANGAGDEQLGERRRRLLLELVDLDERHEAGLLAEVEYQRERAARKAELIGVLRQLEAGVRHAR